MRLKAIGAGLTEQVHLTTINLNLTTQFYYHQGLEDSVECQVTLISIEEMTQSQVEVFTLEDLALVLYSRLLALEAIILKVRDLSCQAHQLVALCLVKKSADKVLVLEVKSEVVILRAE